MSTDLHIRTLTQGDVPLLERLRAEAGWNQTRADLRRFVKLAGDGAFVAVFDGVDVGTVLTFVFGSTAWIALMLVAESMRGRGIGTALMRHALAYLDDRRIERVRLDATPMGRPLYEKLGFLTEYEVLRYAGEVQPVVSLPTRGLMAPARGRFALVRRLDAAVIGADRAAMLRGLYRKTEQFRLSEIDDVVTGFISFRTGRNALQIGPCLAQDETSGRRLFDWVFYRLQMSPVYVDIPADNLAPQGVVDDIGLSVQRTLTRMCRGPRPAERVEMIWASSGPEKG